MSQLCACSLWMLSSLLAQHPPYKLSHCVVPGAMWFPEIWHENWSLFAFSDCSGAVNKEIDDKVVEKRQLGRTAPCEWQRACSAFTAKKVAPSREPAVPGRCAKTVRRSFTALLGYYISNSALFPIPIFILKL